MPPPPPSCQCLARRSRRPPAGPRATPAPTTLAGVRTPRPAPPPAAPWGREAAAGVQTPPRRPAAGAPPRSARSEEHTSELQSLRHLVCRLLLEKKKKK